MSAATLDWSSAIAPTRPPVPRQWHWAAGLCGAVLIFSLISLRYSADETVLLQAEDEGVVVSLGGPARRLDPPPPEVETSEEASVVAERADDAPPPSPPAEPRVVEGSADGDGRASSGTGAGPAGPPGPPAPPPPPPPPPPPAPKVTRVSQRFVEISINAYRSQIIYPRRSLDAGQEGQGILRVTIARDGRVLDWKLRQPTGFALLDREIKRVARNVKRLDPLPENFYRDTTQVDIPISFTIEYYD